MEEDIMNEITTGNTFEERMKARIKDSIGDLITDEDLTKLINRGVEDVFFKKTVVRVNSYENKEGPSLLESIVKELLETQVRDCIKDYLKDNSETVKNTIDEVVRDGIGKAMIAAMNQSFQQSLYQFQSNISQQLSNMR